MRRIDQRVHKLWPFKHRVSNCTFFCIKGRKQYICHKRHLSTTSHISPLLPFKWLLNRTTFSSSQEAIAFCQSRLAKSCSRACPGFEPSTSRTLSENHTPRPTGWSTEIELSIGVQKISRGQTGSNQWPLMSCIFKQQYIFYWITQWNGGAGSHVDEKVKILRQLFSLFEK